MSKIAHAHQRACHAEATASVILGMNCFTRRTDKCLERRGVTAKDESVLLSKALGSTCLAVGITSNCLVDV